MNRISALVLAVGVAAAVWMVLPMARPEFNQVWFVGAEGWKGIVLHGREIASIGAGLAVWLLGLHFPERPKPIFFRRSSESRFAQ
jgi:hypothetical protein